MPLNIKRRLLYKTKLNSTLRRKPHERKFPCNYIKISHWPVNRIGYYCDRTASLICCATFVPHNISQGSKPLRSRNRTTSGRTSSRTRKRGVKYTCTWEQTSRKMLNAYEEPKRKLRKASGTPQNGDRRVERCQMPLKLKM